MIREFPKMWMQDEYQGYEGKYWSLPPRKILPKPYVKPHPPMWYAAGNTSSYAMAARYGLGVLGFSVGSIDEMKPVLEAYKERDRERRAHRRVRQRQRDGHRGRIRGRGPRATRCSRWSNAALVVPAEQRVPLPRHVPAPRLGTDWPELIPDPTIDEVRASIGQQGMVVGDPDDALTACQEWADAGADQLVFGQGMATQEEALETIRLIGEHVIPKIDTDPEHRTSRYRRGAGREDLTVPTRPPRRLPERQEPAMSNPFSYENKRVVVTGGATGVGAGLLEVLAEQDAAHVTVLDLKEPTGPHTTVHAVRPVRPGRGDRRGRRHRRPRRRAVQQRRRRRHAAAGHGDLGQLPRAALALGGPAAEDPRRRRDREHRLDRGRPVADARST